jgi:lipopolysaccharide biosynthesis glycosyltransferase
MGMGTAFADVLKSCFPSSVYYRMLTPNMLPHDAKCKCLKTDIFVGHDVMEIFNTDLDRFYLAGFKNMPMAVNNLKRLSSIHILEADRCIYSEVLIINLELMSSYNFIEKFIAMVNHGIDSRKAFNGPDQDSINLAYCSKIKVLDL